MATADASIIIVTRNRKDKAKHAIRSALAQAGNLEVVVIDDASDDGTAAEIQAEFPSIRIERSSKQMGLIVSRNRAVEISSAPVVISIDDDAEFADPETVHATLRLFDDPHIGAVAIPFINRSPDGSEIRMLPPVPDQNSIWITNTFVGTAFAVRRDVFLRIGGFQGLLFHWGEESEYTQRLLAAGYFVAMGSSGMIYHYPAGAGKYSRKVNRYIYRNRVLTLWFNAPTLLLAPMILGNVAVSLLGGVRRPRTLLSVLEGLGIALKDMCATWRLRRPISLSRYRLWLRLRRERPVALSKVAGEIDTRQEQS